MSNGNGPHEIIYYIIEAENSLSIEILLDLYIDISYS